jgi:hypothetical protein
MYRHERQLAGRKGVPRRGDAPARLLRWAAYPASALIEKVEVTSQAGTVEYRWNGSGELTPVRFWYPISGAGPENETRAEPATSTESGWNRLGGQHSAQG